MPFDDADSDAVCPHCRAVHVGAGGAVIGSGPPRTGDVNVCIGCRRWSIFDWSIPNLLRLPTPDEQDWLDNDPRVALIRTRMRTAQPPE